MALAADREGAANVAKVTMPQLGESVAEGTIGKWLKQPGDHVAKYEPLVEHAIQLGAEAPNLELEASAKDRHHLPDAGQAHACRAPELKVRNDRLARACASGQVNLPPATTLPESADEAAKPLIVHRVDDGTCPLRTSCSDGRH